ncbi:MAG: substrate-binding domain-containing protein, partial [Muribaculaceae bacterium]|nr:substrate-binding domain-containing protein [Muribaculaceae bacterium]
MLDHSAVAALTICKKVGVKVPDQAVILGVDNDEILCLGTSPSLTSILP